MRTSAVDELSVSVPSLRDLPASLVARVEREAVRVGVPARASLFEDGGSCHAFVAVTEGSARVSKVTADGRELLLYHVGPGDLCVLTVSCLLSKSPYPARGVALSALRGVSLSADLFETLVISVPRFRQAVFENLGRRLSQLMQLVEEVAFYKLDRRLAALLLRKSADGPQRTVALTHQELADDLGSSREIVSRILASFETQGLVELGRKRIRLLDPAAVSRISRPEPD